ncbi:hypothetical protein K1719_027109 [Acacia pycnantha]|nr:hypothetical protein K1719_027109 [Acacia pycnantha]
MSLRGREVVINEAGEGSLGIDDGFGGGEEELDSNNNASNDNNKIGNSDNPQEIPDSSSSFASDGNGNPDKGAEERQAPDLKDGLHPLKHKFVLWYTQRTPGVRSQTSYEDNIKKIADFSVEGFWVCYCHLARPSSLPIPTDLHPFKEGIRPLCEDPANCNGGKREMTFEKKRDVFGIAKHPIISNGSEGFDQTNTWLRG